MEQLWNMYHSNLGVLCHVKILLIYSVLFTNVRSVTPKRDDLFSLITLSDTNATGLTETWLSMDISDAEILPRNNEFKYFCHDRKDR